MKKIYYCLGIALAACLSSCTDDSLDNEKTVVNPVQTGDEIIFGSSLSDNADMVEETAESRTVYGDRTSNGVPVYWKEEGDSIAIYCLQSSQPSDHLVYYTVKPEFDESGEPTATAFSVTKFDTEKAGLQWGDPNTKHNFYAFYPASAVKGSEEENQTGKITANIDPNQQVTEWRIREAYEEGAINGHKTYFGLSNMNYAYMYAYTQVDPTTINADNPVKLKFKNLVTVLDITVQGPETGYMTVTNINVDAVGGVNTILTGDFTCNIRAAENNNDEVTATCEPVENTGSSTVRNRISIPCYDKTKNEFITLGPDEYLNVKAYIIPDDNDNYTTNPRKLRITVATLNGAAKVKTLEQVVTPHKINRILLPALVEGGTNYWMSNLDPNIYISELSIPGSKMSFATTGDDYTEKFQTQPLETQFMDGVRAFVVQTNTNTSYKRTGSWDNYTYNVTGATVNEIYTDETLETILGQLKTLLDEAQANNKKNEFAFVQITYNSASSPSRYTPAGGAYQYWIEGIEYELNQLIQNGNKYNIYTDQITPNTKLGDVGGHIVLKVNYNDGQDMGQYIAADATIPALFSTWTKGMDDVALYWGSPNSNQTGRPEMHWYYSEATHIGNEASTLAIKKNQISTVFQESVDKYIDGTDHNYWFMNDIGGCYSKDYSGRTTIPVLTTDLNNYAVQLLQERTQNASLGIVLLNYADKQKGSGAHYQSDWLIQTIIDNNFKFALRKASDSNM